MGNADPSWWSQKGAPEPTYVVVASIWPTVDDSVYHFTFRKYPAAMPLIAGDPLKESFQAGFSVHQYAIKVKIKSFVKVGGPRKIWNAIKREAAPVVILQICGKEFGPFEDLTEELFKAQLAAGLLLRHEEYEWHPQ